MPNQKNKSRRSDEALGTSSWQQLNEMRLWASANDFADDERISNARKMIEAGDTAGGSSILAIFVKDMKKVASRTMDDEGALVAAEKQAEAYFLLARVGLAHFDMIGARKDFERGIGVVAAISQSAKWARTMRAVGELRAHGDRAGGSAALNAAVGLLKRVTHEDISNRAEANNTLGNLFIACAQQEAGTELLHQAKRAYEQASDGLPRGDAFWIRAKVNRSLALWMIADREHRTDYLDEVITDLRDILKALSEKSPDWPRAQQFLANALCQYAKEKRNEETAYLNEAITAYQKALGAYGIAHQRRERSPQKSNAVANDYTDCLVSLSLALSDAGRFDEALDISVQAQGRISLSYAPLAWANATFALGVAYRSRGAKKEDLGDSAGALLDLSEAMSAFESTRAIQTPSASPHQWAVAGVNLANTLQRLGQLEAEPNRFQYAISLYKEAIPLLGDEDRIEALENLTLSLRNLAITESTVEQVNKVLQDYIWSISETKGNISSELRNIFFEDLSYIYAKRENIILTRRDMTSNNEEEKISEEEGRAARRKARAYDRQQERLKRPEISERLLRTYETLQKMNFANEQSDDEIVIRKARSFVRRYDRLKKGPLGALLSSDEQLRAQVNAARRMMQARDRYKKASRPEPT